MALIKQTEMIEGQAVTLVIEVDKEPEKASPYGDSRSGTLEKVTESVRDMFDEGIALARTCAYKAVTGLEKLDDKFCPEEFELKLGISLDSEVGAFIAKAGTGAQIEVMMRWKPRNHGENQG